MEYTLDIPDTLVSKFNAMGYDDPLEGLQDAAKLLLGIGPTSWGTITAIAQTDGSTPAKVVLSLLKHWDSPEPTKTKAAPAKAPKIDNTARDQEIWELARAGSTHAKIAAQYGLSVIRVSQIVALQRARSLSLDGPGKA